MAVDDADGYVATLDFMARFDSEATPALKAKMPGLDALLADLKSRVATVTRTCNAAGAEFSSLREKYLRRSSASRTDRR